jgi:hypothetical protein
VRGFYLIMLRTIFVVKIGAPMRDGRGFLDPLKGSCAGDVES